jgi:hypothetical protein
MTSEQEYEIDLDALPKGWCKSPEQPVQSNWQLVQEILYDREKLEELNKGPKKPNQFEAAFYKNSAWTPGQVVKIGFLDGTLQQKDATRGIIQKYLEPIVGLTFEWVPDAAARTADIRVSYKYSGGGLSCVGRGSKTCDLGSGASLQIAPNLAGSTYIVLHEFGHAMGLSHEHQTTCDNPLDVTGLGQWYQRNTAIDPKMCSSWDKDSVMNYYFTSKNGISVKPMQVYSPVDIEWLSKIYPSKNKPTTNTTPSTSTTTPSTTTPSTTTKPPKTPKRKKGPSTTMMMYSRLEKEDEFFKQNTDGNKYIFVSGLIISFLILLFFTR